MNHKPRYTEELFKTIFLWIGIAFIFAGLLSFVGILQPTASSQVQDPIMLGICFSLIGMGFAAVCIVLKIIVSSKNKLHKELLAGGEKINGTVEGVCLQVDTRYAGQYPYIILYTYTYQGKTYHHKSYLLWEQPHYAQGDTIAVYANHSGKSTVQL